MIELSNILNTAFSAGIVSTSLMSQAGAFQDSYLWVIWGLFTNALLVIGKQLYLFRESRDVEHLPLAALFVAQAIQTFPFHRYAFDSSNLAAYHLSKLSVLCVGLINLFTSLYFLFFDKLSCEKDSIICPTLSATVHASISALRCERSAIVCPSLSAAVHASVAVLCFYRFYRYSTKQVQTGVISPLAFSLGIGQCSQCTKSSAETPATVEGEKKKAK